MLVATRDPVPSPGAHEHPSRPHQAPRSTRFMTAMQIAGSVLAIPVGLGSAYSVYRANFSVDTTCQTLRANIIAMIDKKIDATARRMLVRHDVETFENTCATVDPDAAAAFKTLLAEPPAHVAAPAAKRVGPKAEPKAEAKSEVKSDAKTEPARDVRKPELRTAVRAEPAREPAKPRSREAREPVKESAKAPARETNKAAEAAAEQHDAATDARWLDAVRGALVAHEKTADAPAGPTPVRGAPPHPLAVMPAAPAAPAAEAAPASAPAAPAAEPTAVATAPALPPPTQVAEPAPPDADMGQPANPDRPVPPASIPEPSGPKPDGWLSKVPFVGQVLAK